MGVMRAHGYVVFSRETNLLAPDKVRFCCSEISFIKMSFSFAERKKPAPSNTSCTRFAQKNKTAKRMAGVVKGRC